MLRHIYIALKPLNKSFSSEFTSRLIVNFVVISGLSSQSNNNQCTDCAIVASCVNVALYYYSDMTLSQDFKPMGAQLSMKAALPMAERIATTSDRCNETVTLWNNGIRESFAHIHNIAFRPGMWTKLWRNNWLNNYLTLFMFPDVANAAC